MRDRIGPKVGQHHVRLVDRRHVEDPGGPESIEVGQRHASLVRAVQAFVVQMAHPFLRSVTFGEIFALA